MMICQIHKILVKVQKIRRVKYLAFINTYKVLKKYLLLEPRLLIVCPISISLSSLPGTSQGTGGQERGDGRTEKESIFKAATGKKDRISTMKQLDQELHSHTHTKIIIEVR